MPFSKRRLPTVEADLLMPSLRVHNQICALRLHLVREATYELPYLEEVVHDSSPGTPRDDALVETEATEHICSLILRGEDFPILTTAKVEELLFSMTQN
ncbi:hypothetical protein NDU88_002247 [Pleurodeles waltl]|uniref:Uncharacterized protein n=1 Tax=Pleurodeles waltl TaxID=8319 RepID=A0AAV7WRS6_PLEWA|nr:hypothetical protein NDU88_002247 [Pleurodeles waltl]